MDLCNCNKKHQYKRMKQLTWVPLNNECSLSLSLSFLAALLSLFVLAFFFTLKQGNICSRLFLRTHPCMLVWLFLPLRLFTWLREHWLLLWPSIRESRCRQLKRWLILFSSLLLSSTLSFSCFTEKKSVSDWVNFKNAGKVERRSYLPQIMLRGETVSSERVEPTEFLSVCIAVSLFLLVLTSSSSSSSFQAALSLAVSSRLLSLFILLNELKVKWKGFALLLSLSCVCCFILSPSLFQSFLLLLRLLLTSVVFVLLLRSHRASLDSFISFLCESYWQG